MQTICWRYDHATESLSCVANFANRKALVVAARRLHGSSGWPHEWSPERRPTQTGESKDFGFCTAVLKKYVIYNFKKCFCSKIYIHKVHIYAWSESERFWAKCMWNGFRINFVHKTATQTPRCLMSCRGPRAFLSGPLRWSGCVQKKARRRTQTISQVQSLTSS